MKGSLEKFGKKATSGKAFASAIAAEGGLFLLLTATDPAGIVSAAQAIKLLGDLCGGLAELTKEAVAQKDKEGGPEARIKRLFKYLALEAYAVAMQKGLKDFSVEFRKTSNAHLKSDAAIRALPDCDLSRAAPLDELVRPVFDQLDQQLLELLTDDKELIGRCQKFVADVRREASQQVRYFAAEERYQPVFQYVAQFALFGGGRSSTSATASDTPVTGLVVPAEALNTAPNPPATITAPATGTAALAAQTAPAPVLVGKLRDLFERRFAEGRREVDSGSCERGETLFAELVCDLAGMDEPGLSDLLARSLYNRGVALANLRREADALPVFEQAASTTPGNERVPLSRFFIAYCRKDFAAARSALALVRGSNAVDKSTVALHEAECWLRENNPAAALSTLEHLETASALALRAYALCGLERFAEAASLAKQAIDLWPNEVQITIARGYALARPIVDRLQSERGVRRRVNPEDHAILAEARGLYLRGRESALRDGHHRLLFEVLNWLSLIELALDRPAEAVTFIDEALARWPAEFELLSNKHFALMRLDAFERAIEVAQAIGRLPAQETEGLVRHVAALLCAGKSDEAGKLLATAVAADPRLPFIDFRAAAYLLQLALVRKDYAQVRRLAADFSGDENAPVLTLTAVAEALEAIDDHKGADAILEKAMARAQGAERVFTRGVAGRILFGREDWAGAIRKFGEEGVDPLESHFAEEILWCLFRLEDFPGVTQLAKRLDTDGRLTRRGRRILTGAFARLKNEGEAERQAAIIVGEGGASAIDYTNLFQLRRSLRPVRDAVAVLENGRAKWPDDARLRTTLAQAYLVCERFKESLAEAREISRIAPGSEWERTIWSSYAVTKLPSGLLTRPERERVAAMFATHPGVTAIRVVGADGNFDSPELKKALQERSKRTGEVIELARKHRLPGSFVASMVGFSVWSFWWHMTSDAAGFVWMAAGDAGEQEREAEMCANARAVVVDYSVLCTFAAFGRLPLFGQLFTRIIIPASTRQVFFAELELLKATPQSAGTAAYIDGRLVFSEADPAEPDRKRQILTDVVEFFSQPFVEEGAPSPEVWAVDRRLVEGEVDFGGGIGVAVLTAKSLGIPLASDEQVVRSAVCREFGTNAFCTQSILRRALVSGLITDEEHSVLLERLLEMNYAFVSIPSEFFRQHLRKNRYQPTRVAARLIREIGGTTFAVYPGMWELGRVAADLWLHRNDSGVWRKDEWMPLICDQLRAAPLADLHHFSTGIAFEVILFPSVAAACMDEVLADTQLPLRHGQLLRHTFNATARVLASDPRLGAAANHAWSEFLSH